MANSPGPCSWSAVRTGFSTVSTSDHLMASLITFPSCSLYNYRKPARSLITCRPKIPFWFRTSSSNRPLRKFLVTNFSVKEHDGQAKAPLSVVGVASNGTEADPRSSVDSEEGHALATQDAVDSEEQSKEENLDVAQQQEQQEVDWKADDEFKKFMGNPSIEAVIKFEKKRADRKLQELNREYHPDPISRFLKNAWASLVREKEQLEKEEEAFKALDLFENAAWARLAREKERLEKEKEAFKKALDATRAREEERREKEKEAFKKALDATRAREEERREKVEEALKNDLKNAAMGMLRDEESLLKVEGAFKDLDLFKNTAMARLVREKEPLEKAEEAFKALDLNKLRSCFGFDSFFAIDGRRFGDGGIFVGNLRRHIAEVIPKLEKKLSEAAGREVTLWFMEEKNDDATNQVCVVQPKSVVDLHFEFTTLSTPWGYGSAVALAVATFRTIALMSGFFLKPGATFDDYVANVLPLFGGIISILGVSEIATRITAASYGVKLSPSFLVPSNWTGCLGIMNNYESVLPNKKALFDIPVARTASTYITSVALVIAAFISNGTLNGGENALYIRPQFFYNNPLLSFIQLVIGPYADDLGNVLPHAVKGVGVPVDPLAFAGLLGIVVTSLNLLPCGRFEGGRISQALFGRNVARCLSFATLLLLGIGGLTGSVFCLACLFATFVRGGVELPAKDEITPLGENRYAWGFVLAVICLLTLFPNSAGTFSSSSLDSPFFRGDL